MKSILLLISLAFCLSGSAAEHEQVKWLTSLTNAQAQAQKVNKLILVDFFASWCGPCTHMEKSIYQDKAVVAFLATNVVCLRIDLSVTGLAPEVVKTNKAIAEHYDVVGIPSVLLADASGKELDRVPINYRDPVAFLASVRERMVKASRK